MDILTSCHFDQDTDQYPRLELIGCFRNSFNKKLHGSPFTNHVRRIERDSKTPKRLARVPRMQQNALRKEGQWQLDITEDPNAPILGIDRDGTRTSWARFGNDEYEVLMIL